MSRHDLPYDFEDFGLSATELQAKYDKEHPEYKEADYRQFWGQLRQVPPVSYWDWVVEKIREDDDSIPSNVTYEDPCDPTAVMQPDTVPMVDLDDFVRHLSRWHDVNVKRVRHALDIPDGTEMAITTHDGQARTEVIAGDVRTGFIMGLELALMCLGTLPFVVETDEPPPSEAANDSTAG